MLDASAALIRLVTTCICFIHDFRFISLCFLASLLSFSLQTLLGTESFLHKFRFLSCKRVCVCVFPH